MKKFALVLLIALLAFAAGGVISVLINCLEFQNDLSFNVAQQPNVLTEVFIP